ncbi:hypothetical protein Tco_1516464 [Tanacetum coccineum]
MRTSAEFLEFYQVKFFSFKRKAQTWISLPRLLTGQATASPAKREKNNNPATTDAEPVTPPNLNSSGI